MENEAEIKELISRLDRLVQKENAKIQFGTFGETAMYGTPNGYLKTARTNEKTE